MPVLEQIKTPFGFIRVTRSSDGTLTYFQNGSYHSQANRKGISVAPYIHVMAEILRQSLARDILVIGCAGGSLPTMLRQMNRRVTVVDINPIAFTLARCYFHMPDDVRTLCHDGIAYLRTTLKRYDAIAIDVFGGDSSVPRSFTTPAFFTLVRNALSPAGMMVMNFMARDDFDMRADIAARRAEAAGFDMTLYDWPGETDRNVLLIGDTPRRLRIPSGREAKWIKPDLKGLTRRPIKRCIFI